MKVHLPTGHKPRIEMVPLIDTFFLLLAFFISSVLTLEVVRGLPVELPGEGKSSQRLDPHRLLVTITEDHVIQLEGEAVTLEQLRARLEQRPDATHLKVGLRGDRNVAYEQIVEVLGVIQGAGVHQVSLLTRPESKSGKTN